MKQAMAQQTFMLLRHDASDSGAQQRIGIAALRVHRPSESAGRKESSR